MPISYTEEATRLDKFQPGQKSKFWKPKAGQYRVKALTELEDAEPFIEEGKEPKAQVMINLLIGEDSVKWTMAKGVSPASAYGQLVKLALANGSKLKDLEFMVVVTSDNKKNTYTIVKM